MKSFLKCLPLFNRDPALIFGVDETNMKHAQRFNVIYPQTAEGFTILGEESPSDISAMCCHSTGGAAVPSLVLLSKL